eukprot:TRINITY_DN79_c0_g1_i1.p2 TRINITY_DN79_c0_g1~~TRINITY_DN79_c0_g1_i1.p2  ORF type:complete len:103 (-),score=8.57 TRINITY_DN79_c0_g1_i1:273-581(-)
MLTANICNSGNFQDVCSARAIKSSMPRRVSATHHDKVGRIVDSLNCSVYPAVQIQFYPCVPSRTISYYPVYCWISSIISQHTWEVYNVRILQPGNGSLQPAF